MVFFSFYWYNYHRSDSMKFKKIIVFFIFISVILIGCTFFIPYFEINSSESMVYEDFTPEVRVYSILYDYSNKAIIDNSNVDTTKVGNYEFECKIKFLFFHIKKTFYVNVVDKETPVIELIGNNPSLVCPNSDYVDEGYKASDNYDGDITDKITINKLDNSIIYSVKDSSNNETTTERKLVIGDNENPSITLKGNTTINLYLGDKYYEPGYTASDNCDGDITNKVVSTGSVDTSKIGSYKIKYEVSDSVGNTSSIERTVIVRKKLNSYGNGNIYLTFDDGPSHLTNQILDILDSENVKATFFVTNADASTKRAYNSGHAIALHTSTHNYSYIYSSADNYFNDLNAVSNAVYNAIGYRPNIIRFPGGSSNTISRNYNRGIMSYLTMEVVNRGYKYFDWNVDSNDAGSDIYNSTNIYYNVVNNLSHSKTNVVLMHDSAGHNATVNALRNIIRYGKEYGYSFNVITNDTPVVAHGVNN